MNIVLDENLPRELKLNLPTHTVSTVREIGLEGVGNGTLLAALEGAFDLLITGDKNLRYQQNLKGRRLAILELPTNRLPLLRPMFPRIAAVVETITPSAYVQIAF